MHVVLVEFRLTDGAAETFLPLVTDQAAASLDREPGCEVFDVCLDPADPNLVILYEIYRTAGDFERHLETDHFRTFDAACAPLVAEKTVRRLDRHTA